MADLNSEDTDGVASNALITLAPLLCPANVILEGSLPNAGTILRKNWIAFITSLTARLVVPSGDMKPSWKMNKQTNGAEPMLTLTAPNRCWTTATMELVAIARFEPSRPGAEAEPMMKEPP